MSIIEAIDKSPLAAALNGILEIPGQVLQAAGTAVGEVPAALGALDRGLTSLNNGLDDLKASSQSAGLEQKNPFAVALQGLNLAQLNLGTVANVVNPALDEPIGHTVRSAEDFFKGRDVMAVA
jgi:hypothetical protein